MHARRLIRVGRSVVGLAFATMTIASRAMSQASELERLEAMRALNPRDAVVLYAIAAVHAAARRTPETLQLLDAVSRAPGGLDPGFYRGFFFLRGDSAYERILQRIRAANPPRVRSQPAYTIAERDLQPEGIAFDPVTRSVFVGSFKGKIVRLDARGAAHDFAWTAQPPERRVVLGLRVDTARGHLWAAVDDPRAFSDASVAGAALHQYEIATGRLIARHIGAPTGAFNDVAVASNGEAYATNTSDGSIWRAVPGERAMTEFLPAGAIPEANGITISGDGRFLFVAGWHDIVRVDVRTKEMMALTAPDDTPTGSFDGLYAVKGGLVGIQNGIHPGRVVRLTLDATQTRITTSEILESYHPLFNGVTTGALDGDSLLYFANTQSRAFNPDGTPVSGAILRDIVVLRLKLD